MRFKWRHVLIAIAAAVAFTSYAMERRLAQQTDEYRREADSLRVVNGPLTAQINALLRRARRDSVRFDSVQQALRARRVVLGERERQADSLAVHVISDSVVSRTEFVAVVAAKDTVIVGYKAQVRDLDSLLTDSKHTVTDLTIGIDQLQTQNTALVRSNKNLTSAVARWQARATRRWSIGAGLGYHITLVQATGQVQHGPGVHVDVHYRFF